MGLLSVLFAACLVQSNSHQSLLFILGREGPSESDQFQGLPEAILGCLPSILRHFSAGSNVSTWEDTATEHSSTAEFLSLLGSGIGEYMSEE